MPGDDVRTQNAGSTTSNPGLGNNDSATGTSAGVGRKAGPARGARSKASAPATDNDFSAIGDYSTPPAGRDENAGSPQPATLADTALQSGKKWIEDSGLLDRVNELPQALKDFGTRTAARVNNLSTTQKVVGGAILAVGLGWLATRKGKSAKGSHSGAKSSSVYGRSTGGGYRQPTPNSFDSRRPGPGPLGRPNRDTFSEGKTPASADNSSRRYSSGGIFSGGASQDSSTRSASRFGNDK